MAATAALDRGDTICEFTDRFDVPLGVARFFRRGDRCQLEYHIRFPYDVTTSSWKEFEISPVPDGTTTKRVNILCPDCGAKVVILYFKGRWSCGSCLDLAFRCQLIHPLARKWEKYLALADRLKNGKPFGMYNKTYEKLLHILEIEREKLYDQEYRTASYKFVDILKYNWRSLLPKDACDLPSVSSNSALAKQASAQRERAPQHLLGPDLVLGDADLAMRGDYETDEPGEM